MPVNSDLLAAASNAFGAWQRGLLVPDRAGETGAVEERQENLLAAVGRGSCALSDYLRENLGVGDGAIGAPGFPRPALTVSEFRGITPELEQEIGTAWEIQPSLAARPVFWLLCLTEWLEQDRFDDPDAAFTSGGNGTADRRTRNFLRRTGGLPYVRGRVSVLSDCPLSRAWWRWRVAVSAAEASCGGIGANEAHAALHLRGPVWEELARLSLERVTAINQPRARAAMVAVIARHPDIGREGVQRMASALGQRSLTRSLQYDSWNDLIGIAERAAKPDGPSA